jgi:hypothetical protein
VLDQLLEPAVRAIITAVGILITAEVDVRAPTEHAAERIDYFLSCFKRGLLLFSLLKFQQY